MDNIKELQEEIFCLNFELNTLAEEVIKGASERMMPNFISGVIEHDHLERYKFVTNFTKDKDILDIACGTGYGSHYMAKNGGARSVLGCDLSANAIRYANHRYKLDNITFKEADAEKFVQSNSFDLIVSFETIEHLPNYKAFLENIQSDLKDDGTFIVSTPIGRKDLDESPLNKYHVREWGFNSFQKMISEYFTIKKVYVQLYQITFLNEKIIADFNSNFGETGFIGSLKKKLRTKVRGYDHAPSLYKDWNDPVNYSILEEFTGQYNPEELGIKHIGYQLLICEKKH